ncbi:hypothetical protein BDY24DRAFT_393930 [Mrakia frigida]|uniref:ubiquitin-specific protease UBP6 n=1 Tax=Mrakia frigida TaxID=29902 RepID=UPI003FCC17A3
MPPSPSAMSTIPITIKHSGKSFPLEVNLSAPALEFKEQIYAVTGVPVDRMKVMVKGGMLKDDADLTKLSIKPKATIMLIGTSGPLPTAPSKPITFLEDMDDSELALATKSPTGLINLGNTCYANASIQALRSVPELRTALASYSGGQGQSSTGGDAGLTRAMKGLWDGMGRTTEGFPPMSFLQTLRTVAPQFGEQSRQGGYAQQDADECWTTMTNALQALPGVGSSNGNFVSQFMMGEMVKELKCDEAPEEATTVLTEKISKLDCNISVTTNYLYTGIMDSLDQKIEKNSPTLGRSAVYTERSRLSRLPSVLTIHLVRFYWRRDTNSKAKIMRKVKFPFEFDALDLCTDSLKAKLLPVNTALKNISKDRDERAKIRKRIRGGQSAAAASTAVASSSASTSTAMAVDGESAPAAAVTEKVVEVYGGTEEEERKKRAEEGVTLRGLVDESVRADTGANASGLYELCGESLDHSFGNGTVGTERRADSFLRSFFVR